MCRGAIRDAGRKIERVASMPSRQATQAEFWGSSAELSPKLGSIGEMGGCQIYISHIYVITHTELIEMQHLFLLPTPVYLLSSFSLHTSSSPCFPMTFMILELKNKSFLFSSLRI